MSLRPLSLTLLAAMFSLPLGACRRQKETAPPPAASAPEPSVTAAQSSPATAPAQPAPSDVRQTLTTVESSLKAGNYDQAAADLLKVRINAANFSDRDAAAYRQAMSDAYSRAVEAAARGDPKGKAAMQMIRAAGPR